MHIPQGTLYILTFLFLSFLTLFSFSYLIWPFLIFSVLSLSFFTLYSFSNLFFGLVCFFFASFPNIFLPFFWYILIGVSDLNRPFLIVSDLFYFVLDENWPYLTWTFRTGDQKWNFSVSLHDVSYHPSDDPCTEEDDDGLDLLDIQVN